MDEQYYDIERRTAVKESARELRRKFLRYKDAEVVYMTQYTVIAILNDALPKKSAVKKVSFSEKKLSKYFPADYPASKCERIITELLEKWKLEQEAQNGI